MTRAALRHPAWGRIGATILRVDARRPASWLAAVGAGAAAWWLSTTVPGAGPWFPTALAGGAIAAVMAIGDPPRGTGATATAWALGRAAWPAVGSLVGGAAAGTFAAAGVVLAGVVSAIVAVLAHGRRDTAAEPATAALLCAGAAAGAALAVHAGWGAAPAWVPATAAAGGWVAPLLGGRLLRDTVPEWGDGERALRGPLGGATATLTMAAALGGTVAWLFLAPHLAWCYALVAVGWFVAVAVPQAALGPGAAGERSRRLLVVSACAAPARRGAWSRRPGAGWMAWRVTAAHAAIFGWPLVVAAALAGAAESAAIRLGLAAALAAAAAGVALVTALVVSAGGGRETALAVSLVPALIAAAVCSSPGGRLELGPLPQGNEVEQSSGFWKTPGCPQDDAGQPTPGGAVSWKCNPSRA